MRRRAPTDRFDGAALHEALLPLARDKSPGFDWELAAYLKTKRSQAPDRVGLERYGLLLQTILPFCPRGFPNHGLLRDVLISLDTAHNIRSPQVLPQKSRMEWANDVADAIRLATKHVVDLKRSGTTFLPPTLKRLVSMIVVEDVELIPPVPLSWTAPFPAPATALALPLPTLTTELPLPLPTSTPRRRLTRRESGGSEASVIFCGVLCQCPECKKPTLVGSPSSVTSALAAERNPVTAKRGGQKQRALAPRAPLTKKPSLCLEVVPAAPTMKRPAAVIEDRVVPFTHKLPTHFKVVHRQHPPTRAEAYIMQNGKFLCGLTRKRSAAYYDVAVKVSVELAMGSLKPESARQRLQELAS